MAAYKCPVCEGSGTVYESLYTHSTSVNDMKYVRCQSCHGRGIVFDPAPSVIDPCKLDGDETFRADGCVSTTEGLCWNDYSIRQAATGDFGDDREEFGGYRG
jgi:DnaJ-class molecular chaperone